MPRINQLPVASSVAQTDVLAIDTPEKTYQVPRSVLAPAPYIATIPTGQWSGSGSDYYITVQASNVTADAMLYPFYDNASAALLNGPVWVIPAAGSFTIHTSAIPSGTVTISVLLAGVVGEAQYQVLANVYSKSQVDSIVAQSTAFADYKTLSFDSHGPQISAISGYVKNGVTVLLFTLNNTLATGWNNITTGIKTNDTPLAQISGSFAISSGGDGAKVFRGNLGADGSLIVYCSAAPSGNILLSIVYPHR